MKLPTGYDTPGELLQEVGKRLSQAEFRLIESSKDKSEFIQNISRVLFDRRYRELAWFWNASRVISAHSRKKQAARLQESIENDCSAGLQSFVDSFEADPQVARLEKMVVDGFYWFADAMSLKECHCAAVAIGLKSLVESEPEAITAFAAIEQAKREFAFAETAVSQDQRLYFDIERSPQGHLPTGTIPEQYRSKVISKTEAMIYIGPLKKIENDRQARDWLTASIRDGEYPCEKINNKSFVFDIRAFPEDARPEIKKT